MLKVRLGLEQCEAREVPVALTWTGAAGTTDFYTPANWVLTGTTTTAPYAPVLGDDVTFDGGVSSGNCTNLGPLRARSSIGGGGIGGEGGDVSADGSSGVYPGLNSLRLINGYAGTVSLVASLQVGTFVLSAGTSGAIAQTASTAGSDLAVTNSFTWTSGTLNSSTHLATVTLDGATGLIAPASAGTVQIASNINITGGANVVAREGKIEYTLSNAAIAITSGVLEVDPGANKQLDLSSDGNVSFAPVLEIGAGGWVNIKSGRFPSKGGAQNDGGSFILGPGTMATFAGSVDNNDGPSFVQTSGVTYLSRGSVLQLNEVDLSFMMSGGALSIQLDQGTGAAEINGNVKIVGGYIISGANSTGDNHLFGTLFVHGDVIWTGGIYHPFVHAGSQEGDLWSASGTFTIGGTATIAPTAVDSENNVIEQPVAGPWFLFRALGGITNANGTPSIGANWTITKDPNGKWWTLN